jgi:hypothetical protein
MEKSQKKKEKLAQALRKNLKKRKESKYGNNA